ncbi:MAG TPA: glycine cleavage system aminomethyltransferase GcvT [Dongiaceae bacterium]|jgi:aminomethyltransferase
MAQRRPLENAMAEETLKHTPLYALHVELGAKMVPFAGYDMPVQYPSGILSEHQHTRAQAGLFDVSHMGQLRLTAKPGGDATRALERVVTSDIRDLAQARTRYALFTNDEAGILDDLMVTNLGDHLFLVVNAACKEQDEAHLKKQISADVDIERLGKRALLALQGPSAVDAFARLVPDCRKMEFMSGAFWVIEGARCFVTRSGYTGEDGFEISVPNDHAEALARRLLAMPEVKPIGLGARDSLRLEAGLCLYGHDIDTTTTPIEAGLAWSIGQRRRKEGGFPGAAIVQKQLAEGPKRRRVGILPEGKQPARDHTEVQDSSGRKIGEITSGGFGPSVGGPVAMGYVESSAATPGSALNLIVRGKALPGKTVSLPFVKHNYKR